MFKDRVQAKYIISSNLPSLKHVERLAPDMAKAAQKVYDDWALDDEGYDHEVGSGGICHLIADQILDVLYKHHVDTRMTTISSNYEVHVYCIIQLEEGVVTIDVPHSLYETGGGYSWKKIEGVKFDKSDIIFDVIDADPNSFKEYADYED
jgi:hypothetical protein